MLFHDCVESSGIAARRLLRDVLWIHPSWSGLVLREVCLAQVEDEADI